MESFWFDIRFALRTLRKSKAFTAVAVLTLTLGIGANTAIFSVIEAVLLRPLPYRDAGELVNIQASSLDRSQRGILVSYTKYSRVAEQAREMEALGAYFASTVAFNSGGTPEQVFSANATGNLLSILGVNEVRGRAFLSEEDREGGADVALITDGFWHSHFGGRPDAVGRAVAIDGRSVTIVGILPASFRFPFLAPEPEIWFPRVMDYPFLDATRIRSGAGFLSLVGRVRAGVTLPQAQAELDALDAGYRKEFPGFADGSRLTLDAVSLQDSLVGNLRPSLIALLAAVGFVLLIGCANVASLLLSRTTARSREIAVRRALGASHWRLVRQLLTESLVLSLAGGALGVVLAVEALPALRLLPPGTIPRLEDVHVDMGVLWFTLALCVLTGVAFGLLPSLQAARRGLHETLKEGGRGGATGATGGRTRAVLVVGEVAVAVTLLTGTGLLIRSFANLLLVNPGFDAEKVTTFSVTLPPLRYTRDSQVAEFFRQYVQRIKNLPAVASAAAVSYLPLAGPVRFVYFCPEGTECQGLGKDPIVAVRQITPDFFNTLSIPVLRGRTFTDADAAGAQRVVIINDTIAKRFFPNGDPVGKHLVNSREQVPMEIVGVVGSVKFNALSAPPTEEMYLPQLQQPFAAMNIVVRSDSSPGPLAAALRHELLAMDADLPTGQLSTMGEVVSASVAQPRLTAQCAGIFSILAVGLAMIGIYGVMAYTVAQRIPEIGLRLALGAQPRNVLSLILGQGFRLILAGVVAGTVASIALTRLLESLMFNTSVRDPLTFAGVPALLIAIALVACYLPARRAMRVDPLVALRHE